MGAQRAPTAALASRAKSQSFGAKMSPQNFRALFGALTREQRRVPKVIQKYPNCIHLWAKMGRIGLIQALIWQDTIAEGFLGVSCVLISDWPDLISWHVLLVESPQSAGWHKNPVQEFSKRWSREHILTFNQGIFFALCAPRKRALILKCSVCPPCVTSGKRVV